MEERDIVGLFIGELRGLLPGLQRHVDALASASAPSARALSLREAWRGASAIADLAYSFHVEDCAQLMRALAESLPADAPAQGLDPALVAAATDLLAYVQRRAGDMTLYHRILGPSEADRLAVTRLLSALQGLNAHLSPGAAHLSDPFSWSVSWPAAPLAIPALQAPAAIVTPDISAMPDETRPRASLDAQTLDAQTLDAQTLDAQTLDAQTLDAQTLDAQTLDAQTLDAQTLSADDQLSADERALLNAFPQSELRTPDPQTVPMSPRYTVETLAPEDLEGIPDEMKRLFTLETEEDIQDMQALLLRLEQGADDGAAGAALSRVAHKIKGTAATLGFNDLAEVTHLFENLLRTIQLGAGEARIQALAVLPQGLALLQQALNASAEPPHHAPDVLEQMRALHDASAVSPGERERAAVSVSGVSESGARSMAELVAEPSESATLARPGREGETLLRIDVRRLDDLMDHLSALNANRASLTGSREVVIGLQGEMDQALGRLSALNTQIGDFQRVVRDALLNGSNPHYPTPGTAGSPASARGPFRLFERLGRREGQEPTGANGAAESSITGWEAARDERRQDEASEFDHALRALNEVVADLATSSRNLRATLTRLGQVTEVQASLIAQMQRDVMQVRLVPFNSIVPRLALEARRLAASARKQITFLVDGEMTEMDRHICEGLAEPLAQLVRNAIVHGIESPEERREAGKPATGRVWLRAAYAGGEVVVEVGDDGRGLNPHQLTASAVAAGRLDSDLARTLSPTEALNLIFEPGVTTLDEAHLVGGRGIGLYDVARSIEQLKGSVSLANEPGRGSVFTIRAPISLSIARALHVRAGGQSYALPFATVTHTLALAPGDISTVTTGSDAPNAARLIQRIRVARRDAPEAPIATGPLHPLGALDERAFDEIPVFSLAELLGVPQDQGEPPEQRTALLMEVGQRRAGLLVDAALEEQEVIVRSLPPHLRRRALRGVTVTPGGQLLPLLDVAALLADALGARKHPLAPARPPVARPLAPRVLVVDDSLSIRQTLELTLKRAGFEVQTARDGIEALETLLVSPPRVLALDIEMPRLDGFELLAIIRSTPQFAGVRVVMLTSRATAKYQERARQLGVDRYLIKPCPQDVLIEAVREALNEPAREEATVGAAQPGHTREMREANARSNQ